MRGIGVNFKISEVLMTQVRVVVLKQKENAHILTEQQSKMPLPAMRPEMERYIKYMAHLRVFGKGWRLEEHVVDVPNGRPTYTDAQNRVMDQLRRRKFNIV